MKIDAVKVYDFENTMKASRYPVHATTEECDNTLTPKIQRLAATGKGEGHDQFLTGILVAFDLRCSIKMWTEMERYKFVNFVSSQSTMHDIAKFDIDKQCNKYVDKRTLKLLNELKDEFNENPNPETYLKLLYNVPTGFELTARLTTNYRALKTVYSQRKLHKLPEWRDFCKWVETLPHSELITGAKNAQKELLDFC